jgi:two-component system, chemotaxis family, sensor kinase CheA
VVESEGQQPFCLMVDELIGQQEVVVKSLGDVLGHVRGIAGGAILGDGRVGLIIDVGGLWEGHEGN